MHLQYYVLLEIFDVLVNYYHYPWLVYELSKTIFLGDPMNKSKGDSMNKLH